MSREINIHSIRDLEKRIKEGTGDLIQLKRTRNSLLNISTRVPPEILGDVFRWNATPDAGFLDFGGLRKGSYNFLLVCYHWYEVASHTPELWSFWGNTMKQWSRRHRCSETAPVDLMLRTYWSPDLRASFNGPLRSAIQDRTARGIIRSVHLQNADKTLLASILSLLIPDGEGIQSSNIESISLRYADISDFFARCRFPKLWYLHLSRGIEISSWEYLSLHTMAITTLHIAIDDFSPGPTTHQLLSILASNPRLQDLTLSGGAIPRYNGNGTTLHVQLRHLTRLSLIGPFHPVFQLLHRLVHPDKVDILLSVSGCTAGDTIATIGPYLRDYLQRDGRFRDGLGVFVRSLTSSISIQASTISSAKGPTQKVPFATFIVILREKLSSPAIDKLCIDLVTHTPREQVLYLGGDLTMDLVRGTVPAMPRIQELHLIGASLSDGFLLPDPAGPLAGTKLLPSLRHLHLEDTELDDDDWSPLLSYLSHQTCGGQAISLSLSGEPIHICGNVEISIGGLVDEFVLNLSLNEASPFYYCSVCGGKEDVPGGQG